MSAFTDEQINEIIGIFTQHMGTRQYIGARYVPIFGRRGETSIEWDNTQPYEPLTIVLYQGNSYTSRQYVPSGIDILNTEFWANTGNYNAQVEQYRTEVLTFDDRITANADDISSEETARIAADNTLQDNIDLEEQDRIAADTTLQSNIDTVTGNLSAEETARIAADETLQNNINNIAVGSNDFVKAMPFGMQVDDFEQMCTFNWPSGYNIQGMEVDINNNLYIAFTNEQSSIIRKYTSFSIREGVINYADELQIENNHCNGISIYDNKLYCSSWGAQNVTVINLSNFTVEETLNFNFQMRTLCVGNDTMYIQPYNANSLWCFMKTRNPNFKYNTVIAPIMPLMTQYSYAQDMTFRNNTIYRLCSAGFATQLNNSYIEVYPAVSNYCAPLIVPITVDVLAEFEGITFDENYCYISTQNGVIYRSQKMLYATPQVTGADFWAMKHSGYGTAANRISSGLDVVYDANTKSWEIFLPPSMYDAIAGKLLNITLCHTFAAINDHGGTTVKHHLSQMPDGAGAWKRNSLGFGNTDNGFYIYAEYYYANNANKSIIVVNNGFKEVSSGSITPVSNVIPQNNYWSIVEGV